MSRLAFIFVTLSLASCTTVNNSVDQKEYLKNTTISGPFDKNSSLGKILVSEEEPITITDGDSAESLVDLIEKKRNQEHSKQFYFIDLVSENKSSALRLAALINEALREKNWNYEIQINPSGSQKAGEAISVRLRSIQIEPRDCSPIQSNPLSTIGGYYEAKFGCAFANNIGAMLDSPRDALRPRGAGTVDAQRTMKVLRAYIDGTATGSALPANEAGEASTVTPAN
jgi:type IV pilus biogenesis protein CpaD/CtpE